MNWGKSLRELELEAKVARLEHLLYETVAKAGLDRTTIGVARKEINQGSLILPPTTPMLTYVTCDFQADAFTGWQISVTGQPYGRAWNYQYQYRVSEPWLIPDRNMPEVLSKEHERFQFGLMKHLRVVKAK